MSRKRIIRNNPEESFICRNCSNAVSPISSGGTQRNHCPHCLSSVHMDLIPGDRRSSCRGIMLPISLWAKKKEWALIHRCSNCGVIRTNRIAADDNEIKLFTMAASIMTQLPFPPDRAIGQMEKLHQEKENIV